MLEVGREFLLGGRFGGRFVLEGFEEGEEGFVLRWRGGFVLKAGRGYVLGGDLGVDHLCQDEELC